MKLIRRIDTGRCPWTGEVYKDTRDKNKEISVCLSLDYFLIQLISFLILHHFWVKDMSGYGIGRLAGIGGVIYTILIFRYAPIIRKGEWRFQSEPPLGRAKIKWYSIFKGGIGLPYLRLVDNMIFVVCFLDENGVPVSHDLCVRIQKGFGLFWRHSKIRMIATKSWLGRDEEPDETNQKIVYKTMATAGGKIWRRAHKFVIYNNGEVIGEGRIK